MTLFRNGVRGDCRPLIKCVRFFFEIASLSSVTCPLAGGARGICCPHTLVLTVAPPAASTSAVAPSCPANILCPPAPPVVVIPNIRLSDIQEAATTALRNIQQRRRFQQSLFRRGVFVKRKTSAFASQRFKQTNRQRKFQNRRV